MAEDKKSKTAQRMEAATKAGLKNTISAAATRMLDRAFSGDTASGKKQYDKFYEEAKKAKSLAEFRKKIKKIMTKGKE
tara:strand:+ start:394 stop:627 length:234 start_codon:yes stop_codon:yes gene_type:complete